MSVLKNRSEGLKMRKKSIIVVWPTQKTILQNAWKSKNIGQYNLTRPRINANRWLRILGESVITSPIGKDHPGRERHT